MHSTIMALDVGDKRIGIAISDPSKTLASPRKACPRKNGAKIISSLATDECCSLILVGFPYLPSGEIGTQAIKTQEFITELSHNTLIQVETVDERLSTIEARKNILNSKKIRKDKGILDSASAAVLLQRYLDKLKS